MKKILFINASIQNKACIEILESIQKHYWLEYHTEVVSLRDYDLAQCRGCMECANSGVCPIDDHISILNDKILDSDIIVVATPSYFYNVSGLLKTYIDRSRVLISSGALSNKKFIYIYCSFDKPEVVKPYLDTALYGFNYCHKIHSLGSFAFTVSSSLDIVDNPTTANTISHITSLINNAIK